MLAAFYQTPPIPTEGNSLVHIVHNADNTQTAILVFADPQNMPSLEERRDITFLGIEAYLTDLPTRAAATVFDINGECHAICESGDPRLSTMTLSQNPSRAEWS